jgi:3-(3-hydroxy-phenyl)propionate hydroxylase
VSAVDVAIVGLGPTGAVLANLCGLYGLRTRVFERSPEPFAQPRACHLDAEIARVIAQCGLDASELLTVSAGMEFVDAAGDRLFTFEGFERAALLGWHEDYVFVQPDLDALLRHGLDRFDHVEVRLGQPAPPMRELLDAAHVVVGCDGASSGVRAEIGATLLDLGYDQEWLVVDLDVEPEVASRLPAIIQQVCDSNRAATFVPSHGTHRRWEFRLQPGEQPEVWVLLAPWAVSPGNARLLRATPYRFHALVADRWRGGPDGRVFIAGDAAHQMPPFMGQGMCSGIRDAAGLAWRLAEWIGHTTGGDAVDEYERERRPHVEAVTRLSIEAGRLIDSLAADLAAGRTPTLPAAAHDDPDRWSRIPGLDLGGAFPVGHQVPGPAGLDAQLGLDWAWVAADAEFAPPEASRDAKVVHDPRATYGRGAVLVRPDRYIAEVVETSAIARAVRAAPA